MEFAYEKQIFFPLHFCESALWPCHGLPLGRDDFGLFSQAVQSIFLAAYAADGLAALLCLALAFVLQIILHELGHLLFGLLSGYRFVSFRFGFRLLAQCGLLCRCVMCPPELDEDGTFPLSLYSLGGIFLNLLSGLLFLWLFFISGGMLLLTLFSLSAGILGLGLGLMFALPVKYSDGYNALWLNDDDAALHGHWLCLREVAAGESEE